MLIPGKSLGNDVLNGQKLKQMIVAGALALEQRKKEVDALNVFPVPDGDTGTNMHLTIQSAAKDVEEANGESVAEVASAASMGSLMGARGNSGVILSQLLRGIAKGLEEAKTVDALGIAKALQAGVDTAYKAVMRPVEGTILTVSKETAHGALNKAKQGGSLLQTLQEGYKKGEEALKKTPELLPVLKQAGVVDAGGQGFLIILGGWISVLEGNAPEIPQQAPSERKEGAQREFIQLENLEYPYCTEFLVKGNGLRSDQMQMDLRDRGDSLLVVGTSEVVKIHIHTKNPGKILDYAIQWGTLHEVAIHNMLAQNEAMAHSIKESSKTDHFKDDADEQNNLTETPVEIKNNGIVAVAAGEGIAEVLTSLGVDEVVFGGQTMNPSTEDLAEAVKKVHAKNVYILPNNGNIVLAAGQVKHIVKDKDVHVIPTKSIPQGITALINFNPEGDADNNIMNMEESLSDVKSGEVTYAVRDSEWGEFKISAGDLLGLVEGEIITIGKDLLTVAQETLGKMEWQDRDIVTVFYGQETDEAEIERLEEWLKRENPDIEVEIRPGKQPLYYYIFGVE